MNISFKTLIVVFLTFSYSIISATIINVPGDQPTIQDGINVAVDGDTVLVQPGTYVENINYNGKNIVIGSLFLTTQDTTYISQTIIDGNYNGSVVTFESGENNNSILTGFTITNGYVSGNIPYNFGGGIYCYESNPSLENLSIMFNSVSEYGGGGGIYCYGSSPSLENVTISNNSVYTFSVGGGLFCENYSSPNLTNVVIMSNSARDGGGIFCYESNPSFMNVTLEFNTAIKSGGGIYCFNNSNLNLTNATIINNSSGRSGGGIYCEDNSSLNLVNVTFEYNTATIFGGGIYCEESNLNMENVTMTNNTGNHGGGGLYAFGSNVVFSSENRSNIYLNNIENRGIGSDIFSDVTMAVIVDTFTVLNPTEVHASYLEHFTFDILHAKQNQVSSNLYVSPEGDNSNSGLNVNEPLKTIQFASSIILADSLNPHTIFLSDGLYSSSSNGEFFPVGLPDCVSLVGENEINVILDAENITCVISLRNVNNSTISTLTIKNGLSSFGAGISCDASSPNLDNVTIIDNTAYLGGGIYCKNNSNPNLDNVKIANNTADRGGGICCWENCSPSLANMTIVYNTANSEGGGIYCRENSNLNIVNGLIENNTAECGGGLYFDENTISSLENVTIENNTATYYEGGGIYCGGTSLSLENVTITDNNADFRGGGIHCAGSIASLTNVTIMHNTANIGGGIYYGGPSLSLANVTITNNSGFNRGGGLDVSYNSNVLFSSENRSNIYLNNVNSRGIGNDIFSLSTMNVIVDTFTVLNPTDFYASPLENFTFDILHCIQQNQINSDLYVSPEGDNSNSGLTIDDPLKTIYYACSIIFADSLNTHTIFLSEGVYSPSTNGDFFPINLPNYVSLIGENEENVILDAEEFAGVINLTYVNNITISDMTIMNGQAEAGGGIYCSESSPNITNVTITNNTADIGGGICCDLYSNLNFSNVKIVNNTAFQAGGLYFGWFSSSILVNVLIANNTATSLSGGIYCSLYSSPTFVNVTIANNTASLGGAIIITNNSHPSLINCILWDNAPQEIYFDEYSSSSITISYSDIDGGLEGIVTNNSGTVNWLAGNIDADPLFADPQNEDFHLTWANFPIPDSTMSPCIDAGDPNSPFDPDSTIADMGAFYFDQNQTGTGNLAINQITKSQLNNNYPNPFNPETTISFYTVEDAENAEIIIYNIKGQKVKQLKIENLKFKINEAIWNGTDDNGRNVSSGVYLYQLKVDGKQIDTKRCLLLK